MCILKNGGPIGKLPSLECEASHSNSECGYFKGFTYFFNSDCKASQYKLKMASFTSILQSVSMKRLAERHDKAFLGTKVKELGYVTQNTPDFGHSPEKYR